MTHSFDQQYWDRIWHSDRAGSMGTSEPNPHLVQQAGDLTTGTALDAGCGGGAEAIWLAARGWQVTAADIAATALETAAERATAAGVANHVHWVEADLSTWKPASVFDLVTTHYAHPAIPQLEFYDRLATWVAPGGTLLIVGHLHPEQHASTTAHHHGHDDTQPPAEASATADTITARLDPTVWTIVTAEESRRTSTGSDGHENPIHDVVVRATRRNDGRPAECSL